MSKPQVTSSAANSALILLAAVLLLSIFTYWPSLSNGFTNWDDNVYVTANEHIAWNSKNLDVLATKEVAGNFHPLTMWSLAFDHKSLKSGGIDPVPYHRTNLLLHLLNVLLVFFFVRHLRFGPVTAVLVAAVFAVHPMHVESVAWVSGRKDVLYSFFFLAALVLYPWARLQAGARQWGAWGALLLLYILACLSKPAAIILPGVLWLLEWYEDPKTAFKPAFLLKLLPFLLLGAWFAYQTLHYQEAVGAVAEGYFTGFEKMLFAGFGLSVYVLKFFLPTGLAALHPAPDPGFAPEGRFYLGLGFSLLLLGLSAWAFMAKKRLLFLGLGFYLLNLLLVLGFVKVGSALYAERYTYLSYIGLSILLFGGIEWWVKQENLKKGLQIAGALGVLAFAWASTKQIPVWKNSESLWTQIIARYPQEKNYQYRGYDYYLNKQFDKALADFEKAYALNPNNEVSSQIRAICLQKLNKPAEALAAYVEYTKKFPPKAAVALEMGNCHKALGQNARTTQYYEEAVRLDPQLADTWNDLAILHFAEKNYSRALECIDKALALKPDNLAILNNRAGVRLTAKDYRGCIEDATRSLGINPQQKQILLYRSEAYRLSGRQNEASADRAKAAGM